MTEVLAWGTNKFGQLGEGSLADQLDPVALDAFRGTKIVQICAGSHHSMAVAELGDVFVWGRASEGQWGNGQRSPTQHDVAGSATASAPTGAGGQSMKEAARRAASVPQRIWALRNERIREVATGNFHSLAVTREGRIYEFGRLYHFDTASSEDQRFSGAINLPGEWARNLLERSQRAYYAAGTDLTEEDVAESDHLTNFGAFKPFICAVPRLVPGLERVAIRSVAAGYSFNVAVGRDGRCYTWGYNSSFQLGLGDRFNRASPCRVAFPHGEDGLEPRIVRAACGEQHTLFLSRNGAVYSSGLGVFGQLGHGSKRDERRPRAIAAFAQSAPITSIACGAHHSAAVDSDGSAWVWGHAEYAQMGGTSAHQDWQGGERGSGSAFTVPQRLSYFREELTPPRAVSQISCGDLFTVALTTSNEVYGWGWNSSGALGNGTRKFSQVPSQILRLQGERVEHINAGGVHALALNNTESSTFAYDFKDYVGSARFADIRFVCQNVEVPAHMILILLRCPRLAAMINMTRRFARHALFPQPVFPLHGVKVHVFRALLGYLYTDHLRCTPHWLQELRELAHRLRLPHLEYLCLRQETAPKDLPDFDRSVKRPPSTFVDDLRAGIDEMQYSDVVFGVPAVDPDADDDLDSSIDLSTVGSSSSSSSTSSVHFLTTGSAEPDLLTFYGHRVILAARCAYLRRIFDGSFKDSHAAQINFQGVSAASMRTLLNYIYTADEAALDDSDMLVPILMLSDRFLLSELKQVCEDKLEQLINEENVGAMLILADRYNAPRLRRACLNLLQRQWSVLMHSPAMQDIRTNAPDLVEVVCHYAIHAPKLYELSESATAASSSS